MRTVRVAAVFAAILAPVAGPSCAPAASRGDFDSPNPAAKLYAIEQAVRVGDAAPKTLERIVEQLDSDDDAVRLMAITALERLTGKTLGYRHFDPLPQRRAAIRAWVEYIEVEYIEVEYIEAEYIEAESIEAESIEAKSIEAGSAGEQAGGGERRGRSGARS